VIRIVCERSQVVEWGSVAPKDLSKFSGRLTVLINENDFRWQLTYWADAIAFEPNLYPSQQTLFGSEETVELMKLRERTAVGSNDLHLVVRQIKRAPE
jgi:hypothetical protein